VEAVEAAGALLIHESSRGRAREGIRQCTSRSGDPPFSILKAARSVTIQPFTASAGQVAHQLTTPIRRPFSEATFQNVLTLRRTALGGCGRVRRSRSVAAPRAEVNGLLSASRLTGVRRPVIRRVSAAWIPCASGPRPVAIVVHTMAGTRSGSAVSRARAPAVRSAPVAGISPCATRCSAMRRSRPSIARTRTRRSVGTTA
jgi:hypothetical protein